VIRELVGHGVGTSVHEDPDVPNYGKRGTGPILKEGMVLAIEPMLTLGKRYVEILDDEWTIVTEDNSPAAHYEHTIVVTKDGVEILTGGIDG
jgi:methionyl aminopeptidase